MADFRVDNHDVNDRPDWRHVPPVYAASRTRFEGFPGSGVTIAVQKALQGPRLEIIGWLEGDDADALHQATLEASTWAQGSHRVTIHGVSYDDMVLASPLRPSRPVAFQDSSGSIKMRSRVRLIWQSTEAAP
ncbi:MAG: hypothetical protein AAGF84_03760 [Planctomycetota bacterium]